VNRERIAAGMLRRLTTVAAADLHDQATANTRLLGVQDVDTGGQDHEKR